MKIFRPENFGGILYDTETLRYQITETKIEADRIVPQKPINRDDILSAPVRVYFELTKRCNLACRHCFVSSHRNAEYGESTKNLISILDDFKENGVIDVRFTGGELTVREDWFEIVSHARNNGFSISLNTNGVYDDVNDIISKFSIIKPEQITVSVDGANGNHDYFRGKGMLDKSLDALRRMKDEGLKTRINTVITKKNVSDIPLILEIADGLVEEINFFYMRPVGRAVNIADLSLNFEEHFNSSVDTLSQRDKYPLLRIMHFEQSFTERTVKEKGHLLRSLPYGSTTLGVTCDGNVWPHGYTPYQDRNLSLGNLIDIPLRRIWVSKELDRQRNWLRSIDHRCSTCEEYKKRCAGYNFEMKVAEDIGDILTNPFCISDTPLPNLEDF